MFDRVLKDIKINSIFSGQESLVEIKPSF